VNVTFLQIGVYEEKLRKLRNELRKIQHVNQEAEDEVKNYEAKLKVNVNFQLRKQYYLRKTYNSL